MHGSKNVKFACSVTVGKSLWKIRRRGEGTIRIEVKKIGYESRMCRYWLSSS